jgi:hypothetical protein
MFFSCEKNIGKDPVTSSKTRSYDQSQSKANYTLDQMMDSISSQCDAKAEYNSSTDRWEITYGSTVLEIEEHPTDTTRLYLSGAFLGGRTVGLQVTDFQNPRFTYYDQNFNNQLSWSTVNSYVVDNDNDYAGIAPCDEHPSGQSCDGCVEQEVEEFCDGFASCAAFAVFPVAIMGVIAGHCLACCT